MSYLLTYSTSIVVVSASELPPSSVTVRVTSWAPEEVNVYCAVTPAASVCPFCAERFTVDHGLVDSLNIPEWHATIALFLAHLGIPLPKKRLRSAA